MSHYHNNDNYINTQQNPYIKYPTPDLQFTQTHDANNYSKQNQQQRMNYHILQNLNSDITTSNHGYGDNHGYGYDNNTRKNKNASHIQQQPYYPEPNNTYNNLSSYPIDDYDELKQAYLNHLNSQMNPLKQDNSLDYKYALEAIDMSRINRENFEAGAGYNYHNREAGYDYGNQGLNSGYNQGYPLAYNSNEYGSKDRKKISSSPNDIITSNIPDKNLDKELKRKQQEEYRKFLDSQLREQNERKERMKLEKRGINTNNAYRAVNNDTNLKGIMNNVNNKFNINTNSSSSDAYYNHENNQNISGNSSSNNQNKLNNNNNNTSGRSISSASTIPEKEIEKKKKLEYNNVLKQQIEDKTRRKEEEKRKKKEEDILFSQKYDKNDHIENSKGKKRIQEPKAEDTYKRDQSETNVINNSGGNMNPYNHNIGTIEKLNEFNPNPNSMITQSTINHNMNTNIQSKRSIETPPSNSNKQDTNFHYRNNKDINSTNTLNEEYYQSDPNYQRHIIDSENFIRNNANLNTNMNYFNNQMLINNANTNPNTIYPMPMSPGLSTNNHTYHTNFPLNSNNLITSYAYNSPLTHQVCHNTQSTTIEEMLRFFFQQQVTIINQYKTMLGKIEDKDKNIFYNMAIREKTIAMNQLRLEQERFKSIVGFYPFDNDYNTNMEDIFNTLIEHKLNKSEVNLIRNSNENLSKENSRNVYDNRQNIQQHNIKNWIEDKFQNQYDVNVIKCKDNHDNLNPNLIDKSPTKNPAEHLHYVDFRSKYEELSQSILSLNLNKDETQLKCSLQGFSKLVNVNPVAKEIEDERFLVTWREEEIENEMVEGLNENKDKENPKLTTTNILHSQTTSDIFNRKNQNRDVVNNIENDVEYKLDNKEVRENEFQDSLYAGITSTPKHKDEINTSFSTNNYNIKKLPINYTNNPINPFIEKIKISHEEKDKSLLYHTDNRINNNDITNKFNPLNNISRNTYSTDRDKRLTSSFNNRHHKYNSDDEDNHVYPYNNHEEAESENSVIELNQDDIEYNYDTKSDNNLQMNFEEDNAQYCNPEYNLNQSEEGSEYSETFNNEDELKQIDGLDKKDKLEEINLEDYKDIHEKEKFESQVNFFENSRDNYDIYTNKLNKNHVVNLTDKSDSVNTQAVLLQDIKSAIRDPKDRVSRNVTSLNRNKINSFYDKYNQIKNKNKDENLTSKVNANNNLYNNKEYLTKANDASQFLDSLNNFNENYERFKEKLYLNNPSNKSALYINTDKNNDTSLNTDKNMIEKLNTNFPSNADNTSNNNKFNPINDINVDDSLLNELTKFTKFAVNNGTSQSSILKRDNVNMYSQSNNGKKMNYNHNYAYDDNYNREDGISKDVINEYKQKNVIAPKRPASGI